MKITEDHGVFRKTKEYDYTPAPAELYFWYSGTHAGPYRNNPYVPRYGMTVTKTRFIKIKESGE